MSSKLSSTQACEAPLKLSAKILADINDEFRNNTSCLREVRTEIENVLEELATFREILERPEVSDEEKQKCDRRIHNTMLRVNKVTDLAESIKLKLGERYILRRARASSRINMVQGDLQRLKDQTQSIRQDIISIRQEFIARTTLAAQAKILASTVRIEESVEKVGEAVIESDRKKIQNEYRKAVAGIVGDDFGPPSQQEEIKVTPKDIKRTSVGVFRTTSVTQTTTTSTSTTYELVAVNRDGPISEKLVAEPPMWAALAMEPKNLLKVTTPPPSYNQTRSIGRKPVGGVYVEPATTTSPKDAFGPIELPAEVPAEFIKPGYLHPEPKANAHHQRSKSADGLRTGGITMTLKEKRSYTETEAIVEIDSPIEPRKLEWLPKLELMLSGRDSFIVDADLAKFL